MAKKKHHYDKLDMDVSNKKNCRNSDPILEFESNPILYRENMPHRKSDHMNMRY